MACASECHGATGAAGEARFATCGEARAGGLTCSALRAIGCSCDGCCDVDDLPLPSSSPPPPGPKTLTIKSPSGGAQTGISTEAAGDDDDTQTGVVTGVVLLLAVVLVAAGARYGCWHSRACRRRSQALLLQYPGRLDPPGWHSGGTELQDPPKPSLAAEREQTAASALGVKVASLAVLEERLRATSAALGASATDADAEPLGAKFTSRTLVFGRMADAAKGIEHFLCTSEAALSTRRLRGLAGIREEFAELVLAAQRDLAARQAMDDDDDPLAVDAAVARLETARSSFECMESVPPPQCARPQCARPAASRAPAVHDASRVPFDGGRYVIDRKCGDSPKLFSCSAYPRDCGAHGVLSSRRTAEGAPMALADFVELPEVGLAGLTVCPIDARAHGLHLPSHSAAGPPLRWLP